MYVNYSSNHLKQTVSDIYLSVSPLQICLSHQFEIILQLLNNNWKHFNQALQPLSFTAGLSDKIGVVPQRCYACIDAINFTGTWALHHHYYTQTLKETSPCEIKQKERRDIALRPEVILNKSTNIIKYTTQVSICWMFAGWFYRYRRSADVRFNPSDGWIIIVS